MSNRAVIYCRKSTNRDDKQTNSLEYQIESCRKIADRNDLSVIEEITESHSASIKNTWKRTWFKQLIELVKDSKVDFIIIDDEKRLSRNTWDTAAIIMILEEWLAKWVYIWDKLYRSNNSWDVLSLELFLMLGKKENKDRAEDTKKKMLHAAENKFKVMNKVPFWYENYRIRKWETDVRPHPDNEWKWRKMLGILKKWTSYKETAQIMFDKYWVTTKNNTPVTAEQVRRWLFHKFHDGFYDFAGRVFQHNHKLIVSTEYINQIRVKREHKSFESVEQDKFPLKWIIKWNWGKKTPFRAYEKKWNIYYRSSNKDTCDGINVNINQKIILEAFEKTLWSYIIIDEDTLRDVRTLLHNFFSEQYKEAKSQFQSINSKLWWINGKQQNLLNLLCEDKISQEDFDKQRKKYLDESLKYTRELEWILYINDEILMAVEKSVELLLNLSTAWKNGDLNKKIEIIEMIVLELFVDTKKQLYIQENELFEIIRILNFSNGVLEGTWTLDLQSHNLAF